MSKSNLVEFLKSPRKSLLLVSFPIVIAGIVETLYGIIDAIFVGRLGPDSLAAITYAWPIYFMLVAISIGINTGIAALVSRKIGEKRKRDAENVAVHGLFIAVVVALISIILGLIFQTTILRWTGAEGPILVMARSYTTIILLSSVFLFVSFAIGSIFSAIGETTTAMKIDIYSLVANIILTPIFIFYFKLGVTGAAVATALSLLLALIQGFYYLKKKSYLKIELSKFTYSKKILLEMFHLGMPTTLMLVSFSAYVLFLNRAFSHFSTEHVAAFGIVSRLENLAIFPVYGISIGALTLAGMFYGARKKKQLVQMANFAFIVALLISIFIALIILIVPKLFVGIFTSDPNLIKITIPYLLLDLITLPTGAAIMVAGRILNGIGKGYPPLIINTVRIFIIAIPLSYIFVFWLGFGYLSIAWAMILSGIVSSISSLILVRYEFNKIR